jgi:hypothetical protein
MVQHYNLKPGGEMRNEPVENYERLPDSINVFVEHFGVLVRLSTCQFFWEVHLARLVENYELRHGAMGQLHKELLERQDCCDVVGEPIRAAANFRQGSAMRFNNNIGPQVCCRRDVLGLSPIDSRDMAPARRF